MLVQRKFLKGRHEVLVLKNRSSVAKENTRQLHYGITRSSEAGTLTVAEAEGEGGWLVGRGWLVGEGVVSGGGG